MGRIGRRTEKPAHRAGRLGTVKLKDAVGREEPRGTTLENARRGGCVKYSGNITGGALLARESRIVARLLLESPDREAVRDRILSENLLQNSSPETTRKY